MSNAQHTAAVKAVKEAGGGIAYIATKDFRQRVSVEGIDLYEATPVVRNAPLMLAALENLLSSLEPDETGAVCTSDVEFAAYVARGIIAAARSQE